MGVFLPYFVLFTFLINFKNLLKGFSCFVSEDDFKKLGQRMNPSAKTLKMNH